MNLYSFPCYKSENYYHSFFTSLLFIPLSFIISDFTTLPIWYSYIIFFVGCVSSAHHLRAYGEKNDWYDMVRYLDVFLANILAFFMIYFYHKSKYFYIFGFLSLILFKSILYIDNNQLKTLIHSIFHIIIVMIIFIESLYN